MADPCHAKGGSAGENLIEFRCLYFAQISTVRLHVCMLHDCESTGDVAFVSQSMTAQLVAVLRPQPHSDEPASLPPQRGFQGEFGRGPSRAGHQPDLCSDY